MSLPGDHLLHLDGPLLVFGGPYSNLEATEALFDEAARMQIPPRQSICTGDLAAYGADAAAAASLIRRSGCHVVMGNCEESLSAGASDCGCGFPVGSTCERLSAAWFGHAIADLDRETLEWMGGLPRRIDIEVFGRRLAVVHGGVERINQFVFASTAAIVKDTALRKIGLDGAIGGHCGLPFTQVVGGRLWHNPGVIGMPANDGTPRGWFSVLAAEAGGVAIEHRALNYDHAAAAGKMRRAGLPEEYANALETGLWPSCDVLPWKEIRARGVRLEAARAVWKRPAIGKRAPKRRVHSVQLWPRLGGDAAAPLDPLKFCDPRITADGALRASVALQKLRMLWFNTGTLCNVTCRLCYIESNPKNDRLVYLTRSEAAGFLDEIERDHWPTEEIGFTGGEPFMNPDLLGMVEDCLSRGFRALVLTNAMRPMQRCKNGLLELNRRFGGRLTIRVSLDHFTAERHEDERGPGTFKPALEGLIWLVHNGVKVAVAGRTMWGEDIAAERAGYARLFAEHAIPLDADNPAELVLFPEMDARADVPELTAACWKTFGKSPADVMCATSRMVVKRKGHARPTVVSCTLQPYEPQFEVGETLQHAARVVALNHPHCARFCVLGAASCSAPERRELSRPSSNERADSMVHEAAQ